MEEKKKASSGEFMSLVYLDLSLPFMNVCAFYSPFRGGTLGDFQPVVYGQATEQAERRRGEVEKERE